MTTARVLPAIDTGRPRTYGSLTVSIVVHALLIIWVTATQHWAAKNMPEITEITLLAPGEAGSGGGAPGLDPNPPAPAPGPPAPAVPAAETVKGQAVAAAKSMRFERSAPEPDVAMDAEAEWSRDRMEARLATMQETHAPAATGIATGPLPTTLFGAAVPTGAGGSAPGGTALALTRGRAGGGGGGMGGDAVGPGGGGGLALTRGSGGGGGGLVPAVVDPSGVASAAAPTPAQVSETTARRTVAGASLLGPIADREVLSYQIPAYPDWAKKEAVEASVTLYFVVRADGGVKENVLVQKTAGFEDFDESAREALRTWRFEPLRAGRTGEQWGIITFHFRLRDIG